MTRLGDIFLTYINTEVCPKAREATAGLLSCSFLQATYVGENLLLLLEGQFTKLFKHLLFDSHPVTPTDFNSLYRARKLATGTTSPD